MLKKEEYEVIRLVDRGGQIHGVIDVVKGQNLIYYLKFHPHLLKKQLYEWVQELTKQVEHIHSMEQKKMYSYFNPFTIIVTGNLELVLLDLEVASNEKVLRKMQQRVVQNSFMPPPNAGRVPSQIGDDLYGLGKTVQYILSHVELEPELSKKETQVFLKWIQKCLGISPKNQYPTIQTIQKEIPCLKEEKKIVSVLVKISVAAFILVAGGAVASEVFVKDKSNVSAKVEVKKVIDEPVKVPLVTSEHMDIGLTYFLELRDYVKSYEEFEKEKNSKSASDYKKLSIYMMGDMKKSREKVLQILVDLEENTKESEYKEKHYVALLRGYRKLGGEDSIKKTIEFGEACVKEKGWEYMGEALQREVVSTLASSYEVSGLVEESIIQHERLLEMIESEKDLEKVYIKILNLYIIQERQEEGVAIGAKGVERLKKPSELGMKYLRLLYEDNLTEEVKRRAALETLIKKVPELKETETFRLFCEEFEIIRE